MSRPTKDQIIAMLNERLAAANLRILALESTDTNKRITALEAEIEALEGELEEAGADNLVRGDDGKAVADHVSTLPAGMQNGCLGAWVADFLRHACPRTLNELSSEWNRRHG